MAEYYRERKMKLALTKEGFERLRNIFMVERGTAEAPIVMVGVRFQVNRFYDETDELWIRGIRLRLRREFFVPEQALSMVQLCAPAYQTPSDVILTVKCGRGQQRAGASDMDEYSYAFPQDEREFVWSESEASLAFERVALLDLPIELHILIDGLELARWGAFTNERYEFTVDADLVCLDRTSFPSGTVDYELKVETVADPEEALFYWASCLKNQGIAYELQRHGKARRMRDELGVPYASQ